MEVKRGIVVGAAVGAEALLQTPETTGITKVVRVSTSEDITPFQIPLAGKLQRNPSLKEYCIVPLNSTGCVDSYHSLW
jgi:hypothetical protein